MKHTTIRYVKDGGKFHSRQIVRERLGKAVWLSADGKSGIFPSPQRGLVFYDSVSDSFDEAGRDDACLSSNVDVFPETEIHSVFGDAYLLMNFLVITGMADILKETFPEEFDRQRERNFMLDHPVENAAMKDKEKDWLSVRLGYFVLLSNKKLTPAELLKDNFGRTDIEGVIKTSKEHLGLLPLSKRTVDTVRGKILCDIMNTIIFLNTCKALDDSVLSVPEIAGWTQSLMCFRNKYGEILVETPNKKVKAYYKLLGETIPVSLKISDFRKKVLIS